jgi:ADP-ribose pyrophosphatase YjhB (NUDIX family)
MQIATALIADRMGALLNALVEQGRTPADVVAHHNIAQMPKVLAAIASGALVGPQANEFIRHLQEAIGRDTQYFGRSPLVGNTARMNMMTEAERVPYLARVYFAAFSLEFLNILGSLEGGSTDASRNLSQWLVLPAQSQVFNGAGSAALCRLSRHITIPANIFQADVLERVPQVVVGLRNRDWLAEVARSEGVQAALNALKANCMVDGQRMTFDQILMMAIVGMEMAVQRVAIAAGVILPALYPANVGNVVQAVPVAPAAPVDTRQPLRQAVCVYMETTDGDVVLVGRANNEHGLPGGKVERGETLVEAAIREVREEVGIRLDEGDLCIVHASVCPGGADGQAYFTTTFYCTIQVDADDLYSEDDLEIILVDADDEEGIIEDSAFPDYNEKVLEAVAGLRETFRV